MANQGKRMVPEYLIKKIGEGGGGTEYTAGTGIDISANNEISVDTDTVAMKSDVTTVAANTGETPSATLTDIQVGDTVYGVGGGSADADEKTIVTNLDGKLETAVGGWKETTQLSYNPVLVGTGVDWDLVDPTLATAMFNALEANVKYNVTLTFTDTTAPSQIKKAYIQTSEKTSTKFGGSDSLTIIDENDGVHLWEFYIDLDQSGGRIHVYPGDSWVSPAQDSTLSITFNPVDVYHQIDSEYIPLEFNGSYPIAGEVVQQFKFGDKVYRPKGVWGNEGVSYGSPNLKNIQIGSDQFVVSEVHANTSETVTGGALTDIKVDGYVYSVGGGSGSSVIKVSYPKYPGDVLEELQQTDPSATIEQAVLKWIQDMPVFVYASSSQGKSALEAAGFTNVIEINETGKVGYGDYEIEGPFAVRPLTSSGGTISNDTNIHIYAALTNGANQTAKFAQSSANYELKVRAKSYFIVKNKYSSENATQYATEFASATTAITTASQGLTLNGFTLTYLAGGVPVEGTNTYILLHITSSRYNAVNGVRNISAPLSVYLPGETTLQSTIINQLAAPTNAGTYKLQCTVDASGKQTFAWVLDN